MLFNSKCYIFSVFLQEEDFTGFGTSTVCPKKTSGTVTRSSPFSQAKSTRASDHSLETKHLVGKVIPNTTKPALIGKIVPRIHKEDPGVKESPEEDKQIPKMIIKVRSKRLVLPTKAKHKDEQASGSQSRTRSSVLTRKAGETGKSGRMQNQTSGDIKEEDELSEDSDSDTDQSQPHSSPKPLGHTRSTSQAVAPSFTSIHRRQRKRIVKSTGASPEAGAEAGAQSGEEAAMPLECKAELSPKKRIHKRKSLFWCKRKPPPTIRRPKLGRTRTRRVFYTYVPEALPATLTQDENKEQLKEQNITPSEGDHSSFSEQVQQSSNSSAPLMSARSSRVIKTPKRFLDEQMIPFPKGPFSALLKSQQREDGKPSASPHESGYDGNSLLSDSDSLSVYNSPSAVMKFSSKPSSGTSHVEIYKNLKKLTLKLAEKKRGQCDTPEDHMYHSEGLSSHVKKRRRSKLMMEEIGMDSPGVVRKLAVVVNTDAAKPSQIPFKESGNNSKDVFFFFICKLESFCYLIQ